MADAPLRVTAPETSTPINRTSIRLYRAAWNTGLPTGTKAVLLAICHHHNDQRGFAHPSVARIARMCSMHERTAQSHINSLKTAGLMTTANIPHMRTSAYFVNEQALLDAEVQFDIDFAPAQILQKPVDNFLPTHQKVQEFAPRGGDSCKKRAEITTQNGIERYRTEDEDSAGASAVVKNPAQPARERIEQPSSSSSSFFEELQTTAEREALADWQLVRIAKRKSALPTPMQCRLLVAQAQSIGKPLGWVVQVMALNDWAFFDKSWLQNVRPAPKLPMQEPPAPQASPAQAPAKPRDNAEGVAKGVAKARALLAEICQGVAPGKTVSGRTEGKQHWVDTVAKARRGDYVGHYALTNACEVLGINYSALKAEIAARTTADTATA
jgi:hypothetical protein